MNRIFLSPPHVSEEDRSLLLDAFDSNWIAPLGPHVDAFEEDFCQEVGVNHSAALSSGTAALHLALLGCGVEKGDRVFCSTLTFAASAFPIHYLGAEPVFIDSEEKSWNMDPCLLAQELEESAKAGALPKAVILVHIYGQSADVNPILEACNRFEIPLIEDAAECLGATYKEGQPGTLGHFGIWSFNGNKIITTSGGGMLGSADEQQIDLARKLASQARESQPFYEHAMVGYNYRLSNLLAALGRGQLKRLDEFVKARRKNFDLYRNSLGDLPGISFMPEAKWGKSSRWLTVLQVDDRAFGANPETIRICLEREKIEVRPAWKPMHLQPIFHGLRVVGGQVAENIFARGLCLPSGSNLSTSDLERVVDQILAAGK